MFHLNLFEKILLSLYVVIPVLGMCTNFIQDQKRSDKMSNICYAIFIPVILIGIVYEIFHRL